ncbi:MAG: efflux RND transporter permease subunit [Pseudomonadota bacterium]
MLITGAGSELYSGLGAVVVGGLSMSAFLTLLTVPPLLRLCLTEEPDDVPDVARVPA